MRTSIILSALAISLCATSARAADEAEIGILAALGLTAADGKTEVSDKGAEIEGWLLASGTLAKAASKIVELKPRGTAEKPLLLLSGDAKFDLGAYVAANENIKAARVKMETVTGICSVGIGVNSSIVGDETARAEAGAVRLASAVIGALKVDTKLTGFDIGTPDAALINLIAGKLAGSSRIPSDAIGVVDPKSALIAAFGAMLHKRGELEECAAGLPNTTNDEKKKKAKVDAAVGGATSVEETLVAYDKDAGASLLNRALLAEPYLSGQFSALRVKVEKGGGNLITRKNIFLQFGFPGALSVSAASIVSYRYYDPSTGTTNLAGMLICQASEVSWHDIQAGKLGVKECIEAGS